MTRMKRYACSALGLTALIATACGGAELDGESTGQQPSPWLSGAGPTRGHEDITRFGVEFGNDLIKAELNLQGFFAPVTEGDACLTTSHTLLKGNCVTDLPDSEMTDYYGVSASEFGDHPDLQDLHALRNFVNDQAVSGKYACAGMKARIVNSTARGLMFWQQNEIDAGLKWIGHASHTVQDSFTPCHAQRTGTRFETLTDVCTYGKQVSGVCLHGKPDLKDRIWETSLECTLTSDRPWDCLVPEAQAAAKATSGYLLVVARLIKTQSWNGAPAALQAWFEGDPTNPESGYFLCNGLKNDGWEPAADAGPDGAGADGDVVDGTAEGSAEEGGPDGSSPEPSVEPAPEAGPEAAPEAGPEPAAEAGADAKADGAGGGTQDAAEPPSEEASDEGGCSCRATGATPTHAGAWLLAAGLVSVLTRVRRARR